jgi:hypothetical protein
MRLIDADKIVNYETTGNISCGNIHKENQHLVILPIEHLSDIPTVDAEIVKHGKWISGAEDFTCGNYKYECSCCECYFNLSDGDGDYYYCPNCGAKMDLEYE